MSNDPEIQVTPHDDGSWTVVATDDPDTVSPNYDSRGEAIAAARKANGRVNVQVTTPDGKVVGEGSVGGRMRIVLMKLDGSMHGELDAAEKRSGGQAQVFNLTPVSEHTEAVPVNG